MFRFYIALWASKFIYFILKLKKDEKNDLPGLIANKLCPNFLEKIKKPNLIICITGTNGKTTTSNLIYNKLIEEGNKVSFNDWGANLKAGYTLNLIRGVNIFNKCKVDISLLEADEKTLPDNMDKIKPNYILVTNICKDSLRRNGHPEYIFDCINKTFEKLGGQTTAILNANDPISSELAKETGTKRIFYGMNDAKTNPIDNIVKDIRVCPYCGEDIKYNYRLYRHLGDYYCPKCDFKTPKADYYADRVDLKKKTITIKESNNNNTTYPLISESIHNAYNTLAVITLLRTIGIKKDSIKEFLKKQEVTKIRENFVEYNGIKYYAYATKSQNVSAASTVFEYMAKEPSTKEIVFCLDEVQDSNHPTETITWLYETDYEALNSPNIKKIIVAGHMYLNHKLRLLLAGVDPKKIVAIENEDEIPQYVDTNGIDRVYVLIETDVISKGAKERDAIVAKAKEESK